jgi:hypothetical protein
LWLARSACAIAAREFELNILSAWQAFRFSLRVRHAWKNSETVVLEKCVTAGNVAWTMSEYPEPAAKQSTQKIKTQKM